MSRPLRIEFPGAVYHVTSRGNNHQPIVTDDQDRVLFLSLLGRAADRFRLEIFAFCLMDNHYHLFLRTPQPNLHLALQWLGANYTRACNRRHGRDGHIFKGRYHAVLVDDNSHWLHLSAYIHLNPVRARMVTEPGDWRWSSARDYLNARPRFPWLDPAPVLASFGADDAERRRRYRGHLSALSGQPDSSWNALRESIFLGTQERWEEMKKFHPPEGRATTVTGYLTKAEIPIDFEEELLRLAAAYGMTVERVRAKRTKMRPVVYFYLVRNCGMTGARVAEWFGVSEMAVSSCIKRFAHDPTKVSELNSKLQQV